MPATVPADIAPRSRGRRHRPASHADEQHAYDQLDFFYKHGLGYAQEMANRPQTLYAHRGFAGRPGRLDARS